MTAINSFGIGGVNVHLLIEPNYKVNNECEKQMTNELPKIVNICGRSEEAIQLWFDFIERNPQKITEEFTALLSDVMKQTPDVNSDGFPYRGWYLLY